MDPKHALRDGFGRWLEELGGSGFRAARRLDPFSTSMRNIGRAIPWLGELAQGAALTSGDPTQVVTDLRTAKLVDGRLPSVSVTELGRAALDRWSELGILSVDPQLEIAQCAALLVEAIRLGVPLYVGMADFWQELVSVRDEQYWTRDLYTLHLPSHLDQADSTGYNPFRVLLVSGDVDIGDEADWRAWAQVSWDGAARLGQLLDKVQGERPGGRRTFCRALESCRLSQGDPEVLAAALTRWGVPVV